MSKSTLRDIDRGWHHIKNQVTEMKDAHVSIGVLQTAPAYPDGTTQAEVAFWNEFGTESIPERSFIRSTADENRQAYSRLMANEVEKIFQRVSTVRLSLEKAGLRAQGHVRKKIRAIKTPPNAPATIAAKGSSNPLIDTSSMLKSIDYRVKA